MQRVYTAIFGIHVGIDILQSFSAFLPGVSMDICLKIDEA